MTVTSLKHAREQERRAKIAQAAKTSERDRRGALALRVAVAVSLAVALTAALYIIYQGSTQGPSAGAGTAVDYAVGSPGPGEQAPDFELPGTAGEPVRLSDFRGETVLLYFHEGLGCQPCFDQIRSLEEEAAKLEAAGVDRVVSVTSAPVDLLTQKTIDDGLTSLGLADPELDVIRQYEANKYGMMGESRAGHSFLLIDPEGQIQWRADYGGAPDYTMWLPVDKVLQDLQAGRVDA